MELSATALVLELDTTPGPDDDDSTATDDPLAKVVTVIVPSADAVLLACDMDGRPVDREEMTLSVAAEVRSVMTGSEFDEVSLVEVTAFSERCALELLIELASFEGDEVTVVE